MAYVELRYLQPGQAFRLPASGRQGVLMRLDPGCAKVRYDAHQAQGEDGEPVTVKAREAFVSLRTEVELCD